MKALLVLSLALYAVGVGFFPSPDTTYGLASLPSLAERLIDGSLRYVFGEPSATMLFAGDIMLSRSVGKIMEKRADWSYPFHRVGELLGGADLAFANLENPISRRGQNVGSIYSFRADPRAADGLVYAGFDVLSLANNHIGDYGAEALVDTLAILEENGIAYAGAGRDYGEAYRPVVRDVRGVRVAFLAYTNLLPRAAHAPNSKPAVAYLDMDAVKSGIAAARELADIIVVSFHWGEEYHTRRSASQEEIAKAAVDAGASLVVGHHPHVAQEVERYKDGYIAYSLGNFVFDQNFSPDTSRGLLLKVTLRGKRIESVETSTVFFTPEFQPFVEE